MKDEALENKVVTLHQMGWSIRSISKNLGISRERAKRILSKNSLLRTTGLKLQEQPKTRGSKLDTYKGHINELLAKYNKNPPTGQRIFEILQEKGYDGGITLIRYYLESVRGKIKKGLVVCVETPPGQQGSHDWSDYTIEFTAKPKPEKVSFFSFILHYSRRQYIELVEDKTQTTLLRCLVNTFSYFDGVPKEIKSDNQKACVERWELGKPVFNKKYMEFATYYHFRPLAIHPGKPKENLKIERPFYYLETNFLNAREFFDKQDLKTQLADWLKTKNDTHIHRRTKRSPIELYKEELPYLQTLPKSHYDTSKIEYRIVNNESAIEWAGYFYMVPYDYLYETLPVRATKDEITIYSSHYQEIKTYKLADKGRKDRYIGKLFPTNTFPQLEAKQVIARLKQFDPAIETYIKELKKQKSNYLQHLRHILSLKVNYNTGDIVMAIQRALKYKVYEARAIENFLSVNANKKNEVKLLPKNRNTNEYT